MFLLYSCPDAFQKSLYWFNWDHALKKDINSWPLYERKSFLSGSFGDFVLLLHIAGREQRLRYPAFPIMQLKSVFHQTPPLLLNAHIFQSSHVSHGSQTELNMYNSWSAPLDIIFSHPDWSGLSAASAVNLEGELFKDLMKGYNKNVRPTEKSGDITQVYIKMTLTNLISLVSEVQSGVFDQCRWLQQHCLHDCLSLLRMKRRRPWQQASG